MTSPLPVLFISHGSPLHAIEPSLAAQAWASEAERLPRPRAILMVSAHWESRLPLLSGARTPQTIHDFGGFPAELYEIRYPAPGQPQLANQIRDLLKTAGFQAGIEGFRGLDHGAWVPLLKMYPKADVPVVQLSVQPDLDAAHHFALGAALGPLKKEGVLIVGSGHMTHNLRDWFFAKEGENAEYAVAFRNWVAERLETGDIASLLDWEDTAPNARRAHPTPEHFLPLFVALGAAGSQSSAACFHSSFDHGVLAMDAWRWEETSVLF